MMKIGIIGGAESFSSELVKVLLDQLKDDEPLIIVIDSPGGPIPGERFCFGPMPADVFSFAEMNHELIRAELLLADSALRLRDDMVHLASSVDLVKPFNPGMLDFRRQLNLLAAPVHSHFPAKKETINETGITLRVIGSSVRMPTPGHENSSSVITPVTWATWK